MIVDEVKADEVDARGFFHVVNEFHESIVDVFLRERTGIPTRLDVYDWESKKQNMTSHIRN